MLPPHSLMCLYTLTANAGEPCSPETKELIPSGAGARACDQLAELIPYISDQCFQMDPIAIFEAMAEPRGGIGCVPLIYGYVSYAMEGFRSARICFADIPACGRNGPAGSALGGTGIAVSAHSSHHREALDFAYWVASGPVQRKLYAPAGGQPGHADAWSAQEVNEPAGGFYEQTRRTLEAAWVRPRHNGYMAFQDWASHRLNEGLIKRERAADVIAELNRGFAKSFRADA